MTISATEERYRSKIRESRNLNRFQSYAGSERRIRGAALGDQEDNRSARRKMLSKSVELPGNLKV